MSLICECTSDASECSKGGGPALPAESPMVEEGKSGAAAIPTVTSESAKELPAESA